MRRRLLLLSALLLGAPHARADGAFPDARQILLPPERPDQIIVATNFGLLFSEDAGQTWLFSCEQPQTAFASRYQLGLAPSDRLFALTSGAGLVYSDDDSCSWTAAGGALADVMPYSFAVDPSDAQRVYVIGVPRSDYSGGESIYVSTDGGVTFGAPVYTAPERSALMNILATSDYAFASLFTGADSSLLRSDDAGLSWQVIADLTDTFDENPFELLAAEDSTLYARVLGPTEETLAISRDGGLTFTRSVSIAGKLNAFLKLASGTVLVGGTAGLEPIAFRSRDGADTFEPWPNAPRIHALAERHGKLYIAADNFSDGYAIAESDDEGETIRPLAGFKDVRGVKACVAAACAASCDYHADINLWSAQVCAPPPREMATGADARDLRCSASTAGSPSRARQVPRAALRPNGGGCACRFTGPNYVANALLTLVSVALLACRRRRRSHANLSGFLGPEQQPATSSGAFRCR